MSCTFRFTSTNVPVTKQILFPELWQVTFSQTKKSWKISLSGSFRNGEPQTFCASHKRYSGLRRNLFHFFRFPMIVSKSTFVNNGNVCIAEFWVQWDDI